MAEPLRAADASLLLRYVLNDVPEQSQAARRLIDSAAPIGITAVAMAEVAWVLTGSRLKIDRAFVVDTLLELLARENLICLGVEKTHLSLALLRCRPTTGASNFGDALIAATAETAGVQEVYTFDQGFARTGLTPVAP